MNCVIDNPSCHGTCANCELAKARAEREEARAVARECYKWRRGQIIDLASGRAYHDAYSWLKESGE